MSFWLIQLLGIFLIVNTGNAPAADDDDQKSRQQQATQFVESQLPEWERLLNEVPYQCGRMTMTTAGLGIVEYSLAPGFHMFSQTDETNKKSFFNFANADYFATVERKGDGFGVASIRPAKDLDVNPGFVFSTFFSTSVLQSFSIPALLRLGKLEASDITLNHGSTDITFVPIGDGKSMGGEGEMVRIVVTFDTDKPGFPVSMTRYLVLTSGSLEVVAKYSKFVDVGGKSLPTKFENSHISNGKQSSTISNLEYFPKESLDTARCYLEYYGLARPGLLAEADFGRKSPFGFWLTLTLSIVGGLGVLYFFYQRSRQNYV